ncbi:S-adenosyl-L-methionine-dependent methyltransferase [Vararia minispora EC-137]|uniref:S-adenosyl-L-methionine-dependent methyltransferase n=1 Tax=Vararia minispora EC-137 TaxID=1314806 RepID=A0ACB8QWD1_9AGAM|nr:S-adenosyl-L-methionine-dependent methyltransferase [Vararia minispora EC-137]
MCTRVAVDGQIDPLSHLPPTPPSNIWVRYFSDKPVAVRDRVTISNPRTAVEVAKAFIGGNTTHSNEPKIVIEAFPGPGQLSRALLTLPPSKLKKLIILESYGPYLDYLTPLAEADPRVELVHLSGFNWDTYKHLEEAGILDDVEKMSWDAGVHPTLHFITHITMSAHGDQLVAQLFRNISEKAWLFKYGRVPMSFLMSEALWNRLSGGPGSQERCKVGVIAEATAQTNLALPYENLQPFTNHFHPLKDPHLYHERKREGRRIGTPFVALNSVPLKDQILQSGALTEWDYVLRKLFVQKATPLKDALSLLAPGAHHLLKYINEDLTPEQQVDYAKEIRMLSLQDWSHIVRAFEEWPFKPEVRSLPPVSHRIDG